MTFDDVVYVLLYVIGGAYPTVVGFSLFYRDGGMTKVNEVLRPGIGPWQVGKIWWVPLIFLIPIINATALLLGVLSGIIHP
ncbi:MAG: hypothetical protein ACFFEF_10395 [Candidatus Thorarchaeota archaeon]